MYPTQQIRLLVVDDSRLIRDSIRRFFSESPDIVVSDEAANGDEALELVRANTYDLVLLDVSMPGKDGLHVLSDLKFEWPALPVIMLSIHPPDQYKARALALGASAYLTKDRAPEELGDEIRRIVLVD